MSVWTRIARHVSEATDRVFVFRERRQVVGGCINAAWIISDGEQRYFVKLNEASKADILAAEAEGLGELRQADAVRVPDPICRGVAAGSAYLVLECLDLRGNDAAASARLGRQLAQLHRFTGARFGWRIDNTIGATPQINELADNWVEFFGYRRLSFQLRLAERHGYGASLGSQGERLLASLDTLFSGHRPRPSLLHGDLWSGNTGMDLEGTPVIFDPAVYYGDREADLAMTELFGGFKGQFYEAYAEAWPLEPGYEVRKMLYNLYHVLNHLNIFGSGYLHQARTMLDRLLGEI